MGTSWRAAGAALVVLCAWVATAPSAQARGVARFHDGRALEVLAFDLKDQSVRLILATGGEVTLPLRLLAGWEERPVARPTAPEPVPEVEVDNAWRAVAGPYADLIEAAAERNGLEPALLAAVAHAESAFDPLAVSPKGARGLLQLIPATAERFGVRDVFDPGANVEGGARYLRWLLERFEGDTELALAGYNAGEGAVERHGGVPPYPETMAYVERVMRGAGVERSRLAP